MKRLFNLLIFGVMFMLLPSCSDHAEQDVVPTPNKPKVEQLGHNHFRVQLQPPLRIMEMLGNEPSYVCDAHLEFYPLTSSRREPYVYNGELEIFDNGDVTLLLPTGVVNEPLGANTDYLLRVAIDDYGDLILVECEVHKGESYGELTVYSDTIVTEDRYEKLNTLKDADLNNIPGSESNPYLIEKSSDFTTLCKALKSDPTRGAGRHFMQRASNVEVPGTSGQLAEDGWFGVEFAGCYFGEDSGDAKVISGFSFNGSDMGDENKNIALFRKLKNGATFKNIIFSANGIEGARENYGVLAAISEGEITIEECKFRGTLLNSGDNAGSIIGYVSGGKVSVKSVDIGVKISNCGSNIGGLFGKVTDATIIVENLTSESQPPVVKGNSNIGGIVGSISGSSLRLSNIDFNNTTTQSANEAIKGSGSYVGGIAGWVQANSSNSIVVEDLEIAMPISGDNYVGGLFGEVSGDNFVLNIGKNDKHSSVAVSSNLSGCRFVGGLIGSALHGKILFQGTVGFGVIESNLTKISACSYAGGVIGSASYISIDSSNAKVMIKSSVAASEDYVGGLFGTLSNVNETLNLRNYYLSQEAKITGRNSVGGVAGQIQDTAITGGRFNFRFSEDGQIDKILSQSEFEEQYISSEFEDNKVNVSLKVSGTKYVGGIVGCASADSKIEDIYVCSSVDGEEYVGGAVGYFVPEHRTIESQTAYESGTTKGYHFDVVNSDPYKAQYIKGVIVGAGNIGQNSSPVGTTGNDVCTGGIVGYMSGSGLVAHCVNYAPVSNGERRKNKGGAFGHGGILGMMGSNHSHASLLYYCVNVGDVTADSIVGGVCGEVTGTDNESAPLYLNIQYCANFGKITANQKPNFPSGDDDGVGGILGRTSKGSVLVVGCANHGDIHANTPLHGLGGVIGVLGYDPHGTFDGDWKHNGVVIGCVNTGDIQNDNTSCSIGGIVGWLEEGEDDKGDAAVLGCMNKGDILTGDSGRRGGIVGYIDRHAEIQNCMSFTKPASNNNECNYIWGDEKGDYYIVSNYMYNGPSGKSYAAVFNDGNMANMSTYPNLDLNEEGSYWSMQAGDPHPQIRYSPFQNTTYAK